MRISGTYVRTHTNQPLCNHDSRRLPSVARVLFVRKAQKEDLGTIYRALSAIQLRDHPAYDVVGHVVVDVVGQLDEPEALAEAALDAPRQVARVDRQAMASHAG